MRYLTIAIALMFVGCATTPNTQEQWDKKYAREDAREHKAWCLRNFGVWVEDDLKGDKCLRQEDYDRAARR